MYKIVATGARALVSKTLPLPLQMTSATSEMSSTRNNETVPTNM